MPSASKLDAALEAVRRGFAVFPIRPYVAPSRTASEDTKKKARDRAKHPAIKGWQALATRDLAQIEAWWTENPHYNIGTPTDGLLVVDIDPRKGGLDSFNALRLTVDVPTTMRTITAGGGFHLIYAQPPEAGVRNSASEIEAGIDIRADGGLIVLPGSEIDGVEYKWDNDRSPTVAPEPLVALCGKGKPKQKAGKVCRIAEEDEEGLDLAWRAIEDDPPAREGSRNVACLSIANKMFDYALEMATAVEYVVRWNEAKCFPPLDRFEIETTVESAMNSRHEAVGSKHPKARVFEAYEMPVRAVAAAEPGKPRGLYYLKFSEAADRALTHNAEPLIAGMLDCETMSVVYGESNTGKSFSEMDKDFRITVGLPVAGRTVKQGAVVWVAAEGGSGVYKRLAALRAHYKQPEAPFYVIPCPVDLRRPDADVKPLIAIIKQIEAETGQKVVKVTIDTLSRVMAGGDENSPVDMGLLVHHFDAIRYMTKAHLAVIHHTGKDKAKGARGHSLLRAATDTEIEVNSHTITVTKQRDLEGGVSMRFALRAVRIGVDNRGNEVTSCYVEVAKQGEWSEPVPPTRSEAELLEALDAALAKTDTKEFGWEFLQEIWPSKKADMKADTKRSRPTLSGYLSALSEKGHLKKLFDNQYVRVCRKVSESVGN